MSEPVVSHDVAGYLLGALDPIEHQAFEAHLPACAECRAELDSMQPVTDALAQAVPQVSPSADLRRRVLASATAAPRAAEPASRVPTWLPLAASFALTVAVGGYAARLQSRVTDLEVRLADAVQRASAADGLMADARRTAFEAQSAMAVLAAPDVARIDLAGQVAAPNARARALWSRDRGMVFTVSNLPALPGGRVYQVWVVTAVGAPLSAGLLTPDASGGGSVYFATPADIPPPVALAVTIEPAGGVPAPTGAQYLVGTPTPL
jgi:anti-sigma-K factor RskA